MLSRDFTEEQPEEVAWRESRTQQKLVDELEDFSKYLAYNNLYRKGKVSY